MHIQLVFRLRELGWGFSSCHALDLAHWRELLLGDDHRCFDGSLTVGTAAPRALPLQKGQLPSVLHDASVVLQPRL